MEKIINEEMIIAFMQEHNLQAKELCKMCKMPIGTLTKILNNDLDYDFIYILRIANVMNIDFRELLAGWDKTKS